MEKKAERKDIVNGMGRKLGEATFLYKEDTVVVEAGDRIEWFKMSDDPNIDKTILEFAREAHKET